MYHRKTKDNKARVSCRPRTAAGTVIPKNPENLVKSKRMPVADTTIHRINIETDVTFLT